jgi:hypothetical protein
MSGMGRLDLAALVAEDAERMLCGSFGATTATGTRKEEVPTSSWVVWPSASSASATWTLSGCRKAGRWLAPAGLATWR